MELTDKGIVAAVGVGMSLAGGFATVITWILSRASKVDGPPMDTSEFLKTLRQLGDSMNRSQIEIAEMRRDQQHFAERMERFEEHRNEDHKLLKKLDKIMYPLLKDEIAKQRREMGLSDPDDSPHGLPA